MDLLYRYMSLPSFFPDEVNGQCETRIIPEYLQEKYGVDPEAKEIEMVSYFDFCLYKLDFLVGKKKLFFSSTESQNDLFENFCWVEEAVYFDEIYRDAFANESAKKKYRRLNSKYQRQIGEKNFFMHRCLSPDGKEHEYPGLFCMTKNPLSHHMWSHYGGANHGVCIGINGFPEIIHNENMVIQGDLLLTKVNYLGKECQWTKGVTSKKDYMQCWRSFKEQFDALNKDKMPLTAIDLLNFMTMSCKPEFYAPEDEFRLITALPGVKEVQEISEEADISQVILGPRMNTQMENWIKRSYLHFEYKKVDLDFSSDPDFRLRLTDV